MKKTNLSTRYFILLTVIALQAFAAGAITFTNNTYIGVTNTNFDGQPVVVTNCTLTVDGPHTFADVDIQNNGVLTHTVSPTGGLVISVSDEAHIFSSNNWEVLIYPNVLTNTVVVTDLTGTNTYTNGTDYALVTLQDGIAYIVYRGGTSIPEGSTILVSYEASLYGLGLNLAVNNNFQIEIGGQLNANGAGYGGGLGPGAGTNAVTAGSGGGFGGNGGASASGAPGGAGNGVISNAFGFGSGGGSGSGLGGAGGGAINLVVGGLLRVDGTLTANGSNATSLASGGGAGGGVQLSAQTLSGSGAIMALGGNGGLYNSGGGGGGGRVAIYFATNQFAGTMWAQGGAGSVYGGAGTIYLLHNLSNAVAQVTVANAGVPGASTPWNNTTGFDLVLTNAAVLALGQFALGQYVSIHSLAIGPDSWLTLSTNAAFLNVTSNVVILAGGGIFLDGLGYVGGTGPQAGRSISTSYGTTGGGGGDSGAGGSGLGGSQGGASSGSIYIQPGSGGGNGGGSFPYDLGGSGGGALELAIGGSLILDGTITANGAATPSSGGGGGAGGSIGVSAGNITGNGWFSVNGGAGDLSLGGGGGGGAISIHAQSNLFTGTISAHGGQGANYGGAGFVYIQTPLSTLLTADNAGVPGPFTLVPEGFQYLSQFTVSGGANVLINNQFISPIGNLFVASNSSLTCSNAFNSTALLNVTNATIASGGSLVVIGAGGMNGGLLQMTVGQQLTVNGTLTANGSAAIVPNGNGGAGGVLSLTATNLSGSGVISANGGAGDAPYGSGGHGGTISISFRTNLFTGQITAYGGIGFSNGPAGTVIYQGGTNGITQIVLDNGGRTSGSATLLTNLTNITVTNLTNITGAYNLTITGGALARVPSYPPINTNLNNLFIGADSWLDDTNYQTELTLSASNVTIQAGGGIRVDGAGYFGGQGPGAGRSGSLPPLGISSSSGGGFGGYGGAAGTFLGTNGVSGGATYGYANTPLTQAGFGSPGGGSGGFGGGAVVLNVVGTLDLEGLISANGLPGLPQGSGGGSGGGVYLAAGLFTGMGSVTANGGAGDSPLGGGGGGGRIIIKYYTNQFGGSLSAHGGGGANTGGAGTIYFSSLKTSFPPPAQFTVDNGGAATSSQTPLIFSSLNRLAPSINLTISGGAVASEGAIAEFSITNLNIISNAFIYFTNATTLNELNPSGNATVQAGSGIVLDGTGYPGGQGPGVGRSQTGVGGAGGGGGYGGFGGMGATNLAYGGAYYGSYIQPTNAGSGGGFGVQNGSLAGSAGGGALEMTVGGVMLLNGVISASGNMAPMQNGGGGSGGSIWINAGQFSGSGLISANGGPGDAPRGGGGGGGRIAIYCPSNTFSGAYTAYGGGGANYGGAGTIYVASAAPAGQIILDNGGNRGTNTPVYPLNAYSLTIGGGAVGLCANGTLGSLLINSNGWLGEFYTNVIQSLSVGGLSLAVSGSATIQAGGGIVVDAQGYGANGSGSGHSSSGHYGTTGGGGAFGGNGGNSIGGVDAGTAYGSALQSQPPNNGFLPPGSGGGGISGGLGGGSVQLLVSNLTVNGIITANGGAAGYDGSGGGSGGNIRIMAGGITGDGLFAANGGPGDGNFGGGGGGGRITLISSLNTFSGNVAAHGGPGANYGGAGTVFSATNVNSSGLLVIDNGGFAGADSPVAISNNIVVDLSISGGAIAFPGNSNLVLNSLAVKSGAQMIGGPELTTGATPPYNLTLTVLGKAFVDTNSAISVDDQGYNGGSGPGEGVMTNGVDGSGAGYGGAGGASASGEPGGAAYGSAAQPTDFGSGGGFNPAYPDLSQGAGAMRLMVGGDMTVNGALSANGNNAVVGGSGGGSGGSIWVTARQLDGQGSIRANGGAGYPAMGGGGGGGRIALYTRTNNFVGALLALGGAGAFPGQNGTIVTNTIPLPQVIAQSPTGTIFYAASNVVLTFSSPLNLALVPGAPVTFDTPNGTLLAGSVAAMPLNVYDLQLNFPSQNEIGYYDFEVGPSLQDIYGLPLSPSYQGSFVILPPVISGQVTDTNSQPVAYATVHATGGIDSVLTDANGDYSLEVLPSWTGTITPSKGEAMFLPPSRSYTGLSDNVTNQNFVLITPAALTLGLSSPGPATNLSLYGIRGATYQLYSSTNLVNWQPYGSPSVGSNAWVSLPAPYDGTPARFYRFSVSY